MLQYAQDNDQGFPPGQGGTGVGWAGEIYPYVKSRGIFICPDDSSRTTHTVSYGYNSNLASLTPRKITLYSLDAITTTVMGFEVMRDHADATKADEGAVQGATTFSAAGNGLAGGLHSRLRGPDPVQYARARHYGGANWIFTDGHVEYLNFHAPSDPQAPSYAVQIVP